VKIAASVYRSHNPYDEVHRVSRLRENLTSGSEGEGLETGQMAPRQSFTRQNFFNENGFLGLDRLPSLELNAIQSALTLKLVSFHLVDNFRKNLPRPFSTMKPESIYQHFIQGVQGKVQLKKDEIHVDIYGFQHRDMVAALFNNLQQKLSAQQIDPRCPWLNDRPLSFSFK
jgi:hypothetical protein